LRLSRIWAIPVCSRNITKAQADGQDTSAIVTASCWGGLTLDSAAPSRYLLETIVVTEYCWAGMPLCGGNKALPWTTSALRRQPSGIGDGRLGRARRESVHGALVVRTIGRRACESMGGRDLDPMGGAHGSGRYLANVLMGLQTVQITPLDRRSVLEFFCRRAGPPRYERLRTVGMLMWGPHRFLGCLSLAVRLCL